MKTLLTAVLFLAMAVPAMATEPITKNLEITYDYLADDADRIEGFNLLRDGVEVCRSDDPVTKMFVCDSIEFENKAYSFTLVARSKYGPEDDSDPSDPYEYIPPQWMFGPITSPTIIKIIIPVTINLTVNGVPQ